ncbi:MAG: recombination-associated protein RdgC [Deltaproteobacteria bacterium]|jgi:DNA recombination-dependent growth factor C|nr:recombination-associated protein RdgC [Deltaproteobacteria bacterium]
MGLLKGTPTISRYRLLDAPLELTDAFVQEKLQRHGFVDIETTAEETSLGWVEFLDPRATNFDPHAWRFGGFLAFTARIDSRRLPNKILNRYYLIEEAKFVAETGRKPNAQKKKEVKESLRLELLRRCLLDTDLLEVLWFTKEREIWLGGAGEKKRQVFEDLWEKTFGLAARLLAPITMGLEMVTKEQATELLKTISTSLWED